MVGQIPNLPDNPAVGQIPNMTVGGLGTRGTV